MKLENDIIEKFLVAFGSDSLYTLLAMCRLGRM